MFKKSLLVFILSSMLPAMAWANEKIVTFATGASESSVFDISTVDTGSGAALGIVMPSSWTEASLVPKVSRDNGATWNPVYDANGNLYVITTGASRYVLLDPSAFVGVRYIKFVSGTVDTPVTQEAGRTLFIQFGRF